MDRNKIRQGAHFEGSKVTFDVSVVHRVAHLPVSALGSDFKFLTHPLTFLSYGSLERRGQSIG